jgi:hypothetical protein
MHAKIAPYEWPLYSLCPMNASIYAFECPMQEIPYERKWKESNEKEKKTPKSIV